MSGTVSSATPNLASELLLNKIMNGTVSTSTGKTITAAGRAISQDLSNSAYSARTAEKNMAYGQTLVEAAQNQVSDIRDRLTAIRTQMADIETSQGGSSTLYKSLAAKAKLVVSDIIANTANYKVNNQKMFNGSIALNAGEGLKITVLKEKLSKALLSTAKVKIASVKDSTTATAAITALDTAINSLTAMESGYSNQVKQLQNRALILADQGASLDSAAASQSVASLSGASNLLGAMLGSTQA